MNKILINILAAFIPGKENRKNFRWKNRAKSIKKSKNLLLNNKIILVHRDGSESQFPVINGLKVIFNGKNSTIRIHEPCNFENTVLMMGDDNIVEIKGTIHFIKNLITPGTMSKGSKLFIGENFSCNSVRFFMGPEINTKVSIGDDCMFSCEINIMPSDMHTIIDKDNNPINKCQDIYIGNHIWVGMQCLILKGSCIPNNSIIGACSVFTKHSNSGLLKHNSAESYNASDLGSIYAGMPAKKVKNDVKWDRRAYDDFIIN